MNKTLTCWGDRLAVSLAFFRTGVEKSDHLHVVAGTDFRVKDSFHAQVRLPFGHHAQNLYSLHYQNRSEDPQPDID